MAAHSATWPPHPWPADLRTLFTAALGEFSMSALGKDISFPVIILATFFLFLSLPEEAGRPDSSAALLVSLTVGMLIQFTAWLFNIPLLIIGLGSPVIAGLFYGGTGRYWSAHHRQLIKQIGLTVSTGLFFVWLVTLPILGAGLVGMVLGTVLGVTLYHRQPAFTALARVTLAAGSGIALGTVFARHWPTVNIWLALLGYCLFLLVCYWSAIRHESKEF